MRTGRSAPRSPAAESRRAAAAAAPDQPATARSIRCRRWPGRHRAPVDRIAQRLADVFGGGGRKPGERIGAGRGDGHAGRANQRQRQRMGRHAQPDGRQAGRHDIGNRRLLRQDQRQGPGPVAARQRSAASGHSSTRPRAISIESTCTMSGLWRGRPFHREDARHGRGIERIGAQAVDRLGGKRDQPASESTPPRIGVRPVAFALGVASVVSAHSGSSSLPPSPASCPSCGRPGRRGSAAPDRLPARGPRRRWPAWCGGP
jgi:hypothetical protein